MLEIDREAITLITQMSAMEARAACHNEHDMQHISSTHDKVAGLNCAITKNALSDSNVFATLQADLIVKHSETKSEMNRRDG